MKKLLGTLNSKKLKATEPLRIGLKDIRDSDKKDKWWLVGASWAGPSAEDKRAKKQAAKDQDGDDDDDESLLLDSEDEGMPDLGELAREQGMNTDVRRSIFISILSATDYEDAYHRILKLRLNKERQREIPNVIVQCSGAEQHYNPYYTLIAKKFCGDRKIRWAFQDSLWRMFRRLGESVFGEDADDDDEDETIDMRRVVNVAKPRSSRSRCPVSTPRQTMSRTRTGITKSRRMPMAATDTSMSASTASIMLRLAIGTGS